MGPLVEIAGFVFGPTADWAAAVRQEEDFAIEALDIVDVLRFKRVAVVGSGSVGVVAVAGSVGVGLVGAPRHHAEERLNYAKKSSSYFVSCPSGMS